VPARRLPWLGRRPLLVFLGASVLLHGWLLVVAPTLAPRREPTNVRTLEVVISRPEPLPAVLPGAQGDVAPTATKREAAAPKRSQPEPTAKRFEIARPAVSEPPKLPSTDALPAAQSAFTIPATPSETRAAVAETKPPPTETMRAPGAADAPASHATYLHNPSPVYPLLARRNGEQGTVMLKVLVARDGTPVSVSIDKSSGSAQLDRSALDTVRTWRFVPAREGAEAVEAWVVVPIVFRLDGAS